MRHPAHRRGSYGLGAGRRTTIIWLFRNESSTEAGTYPDLPAKARICALDRKCSALPILDGSGSTMTSTPSRFRYFLVFRIHVTGSEHRHTLTKPDDVHHPLRLQVPVPQLVDGFRVVSAVNGLAQDTAGGNACDCASKRKREAASTRLHHGAPFAGSRSVRRV